MTASWLAALLVGAVLVGGCAPGGTRPAGGIGDLAGEWRGRWLGPAGHARAALSVKPDGAYRMALFLDGGDRVVSGTVVPLSSGRLRYQDLHGNGEVRVERDGGVRTLRFVPDGGGGGGAFRRAP
jgi:hypothetical protein